MAQKVYTVEGRQFRTESDYARAKHDKEIIDRLRKETDLGDRKELEALKKKLAGGQFKFMTLLGQDFQEEIDGLLKASGSGRKTARLVIRDREKPAGTSERQKAGRQASRSSDAGRADRTKDQRDVRPASGRQNSPPGRGEGVPGRQRGQKAPSSGRSDAELNEIVQEELEKREKWRKRIVRLCSAAAVLCLGYYGIYAYYLYRTESTYRALSELKENPVTAVAAPAATPGPLYTLDAPEQPREVLEEYKNLLIANQKLIGWIKIDDTYIDYPVMQTDDNEYYLDHNTKQEYDKNGTIFMDKDCDVLKPSTNYILYGHHMKSGKMFGKLDAYQKESYYKEHPYISFDTIYEKGTYQVMYVFRSRVYKESEIVFKYYQFIDANSEQEFDSYMQEMAAMSLYDTGVTAQYGDQLLTLSTCDYQETDGRFVVVAKKIAKE